MKKANGLFIFMDLLLIIIFIEALYPPITLLASPMLVILLCLIAWCALSFIRDPYFYVDFEKNARVLYPMVFLVVSIVLPYICGNPTIGNRYASLALLPMGYIIFNYYDKHDKLNRLRRVVCIAAMVATVTFVRTLIALIENPNICRSIKTEGAYTENLYRQGIGGYSFVYFIALCCIVVLYIAIKRWRIRTSLPLLCLYGIMTYFTLKSNYVTALLIVVFCSAVLIIAEFVKRRSIGVITLIFVVFILVVVYEREIIETFEFLIPERIATVIVDKSPIFESFFNEFMSDRFPVMATSVKTYLENPLGGLVVNERISVSGGFLEGFGQHSHVFDTFALYGTTIGILNVLVLLRPFRNNRGRFIQQGVSLTVAMMFAAIIVLVFNNSTDAIALAFTIIYPLARDYGQTTNEVVNRSERHGKK